MHRAVLGAKDVCGQSRTSLPRRALHFVVLWHFRSIVSIFDRYNVMMTYIMHRIAGINLLMASLCSTSGRGSQIPFTCVLRCKKAGGIWQAGQKRALNECRTSNFRSESGPEDKQCLEESVHFELPDELQGVTQPCMRHNLGPRRVSQIFQPIIKVFIRSQAHLYAGLTISDDGQYLVDSKTGNTINEFGATRFDVAVRGVGFSLYIYYFHT